MQAINVCDEGRQAIAELNARFRAPLMRFFLRRVSSSAEAEDLTQEVFMRVIGASREAHIQNPQAFVFRIAVNLLRDRHRKLMRSGMPVFVPIEEDVASALEQELMEHCSPERVLLGRETLAEALRTLGEIGPLTREIFVLFRLEKMKQKDIASLYGIGQSTVEKHVIKAVAYLAARYRDKL